MTFSDCVEIICCVYETIKLIFFALPVFDYAMYLCDQAKKDLARIEDDDDEVDYDSVDEMLNGGRQPAADDSDEEDPEVDRKR